MPEEAPEQPPITSPVIDYEPPPHRLGTAELCPAPTNLHRHNPRRLRLVEPPREHPPHTGATQFADMALRRVLEVVDRRRPPAQLRPLMRPPLVDVVVAFAHARHATTATLRRVRLRATETAAAAEVFATYTRGPRVRAIAARVEFDGTRWQLTALQLG